MNPFNKRVSSANDGASAENTGEGANIDTTPDANEGTTISAAADTRRSSISAVSDGTNVAAASNDALSDANAKVGKAATPLADTFTYQGVTHQIAQWGNVSKPPLVLLHGFAQSTETWDIVAPVLAEEHYVVAFDFVGHGKSDRPVDPAAYEMSAILETLAVFVKECFPHKIALAGYSMGGRIALAFACLNPSLLSALVLESAGLGPKTELQHNAAQHRDADMIERLRTSDIESFMDYWQEVPTFASQKALPEALRERVRQGRIANDPQALAYTIRGTGQHSMTDYSERIKRLPMPILYIAGILDRKYLKIAENLQYEQNISCVLANAGHNTHLEKPESFCRQVNGFLAAQEKRAGRR